MKQSRLFPPASVSLIAIVIVSVSHVSAAVASWDDIDSAVSGYYDPVHHLGDSPRVTMQDLDEFNTFKILPTVDSVQLLGNPDEIHRQDHSRDIVIYETFYSMPDELLTLQIYSQPLVWDQLSEEGKDMQSTSEPADDIVFKNNGDYIKSIRTPAPASLLLVAIGLISLRYTRSLRL
jgi:hypothetical protein